MVTVVIAVGLVGALALYLGITYVIASILERQGAAVPSKGGGVASRMGSLGEIAKRHGLSWAAAFLALFVLLNAIDVPFGQQIAISAVLGGFFASLWLQAEKSKRSSPAPISPSVRVRVAWYWTLVWL